jgi:pyridoxal phosphate enzyme (YggS family)
MPTISDIKASISLFETKYGRNKGSVQLLAVCKGQSIEKMKTTYEAGQRLFAENYLQEALKKMTELNMSDIEWHFIGKIQRNKTRKIAEHFAWVQSIDDLVIAKRLNDQRPEHLPPLNICIEVNISHETSKSGTDKEHLLALAKACAALPRLKLRGLMSIPAPAHDFDSQKKSFHQLSELYQLLCDQGFALDTLSMGMSEDYEAAIAEGSTMVRLGRAIFGGRM